MAGKICLITGGTDGIGLATARGLAEQGATTVIVGRNQAKGESVLADIARESGNQAVEFLLADLSSQREVRSLARRFVTRHDRLDVLVNNVGVVNSRRETSVDGLEMTFAVNHLCPFLLSRLLLEVLRASAPSRIINVSSGLHVRARLDFSDLQRTRRYRGNRVYAETKLANLLFTYELARRLEGTGVTVNAMNPGLVASRLGMAGGTRMRLAKTFANTVFGTSAEQGAETVVWMAAAPELERVSGRYFEKCAEKGSSQASHDPACASRLWDVSVELTNRTLPEGGAPGGVSPDPAVAEDTVFWPPGRRAWNDFRVGDRLLFRHADTVCSCRVVSPPWLDNTGVVVEIELPDGRVVRCHDSDLDFRGREQ
jgi:retinol dehydrogenase 14